MREREGGRETERGSARELPRASRQTDEGHAGKAADTTCGKKSKSVKVGGKIVVERAEQQQRSRKRVSTSRQGVAVGVAVAVRVEVGVGVGVGVSRSWAVAAAERAKSTAAGLEKGAKMRRRRPPAGNKGETRTIKIQQQRQQHVENGLHSRRSSSSSRSRGRRRKQTKQKKKLTAKKKLTHFETQMRGSSAGFGLPRNRQFAQQAQIRRVVVRRPSGGRVLALGARLFDIRFDRLTRMSCANPLAANRARTSRGTNLISA